MTRRLASVPDTPKRAGLYIRVSAVMGRSDETFRSPDLQVDAIRRALPGLGATEHRQYVDIDRTGTDFQRAGIVQAIADAQAGEIDLLVTYDLARFGRNVSESLTQIKALRKAGVPLASTVERFDDTPEGQFMLTQFLALAELYAKQIGRRWAQLKAYRVENGLYSGSTPPLGYRREAVEGQTTAGGRQKVSGPLLIDPVLGPAVQRVFADYAAEVPIAEICRRFVTARGVATAKTVIKDMLTNPVYVGRLRAGGAEHQGLHDRLVADRTWKAVQRRLARDRTTPSRTLAVSHSLVGLAHCATCTYTLVAHRDARRNLHRLHCREDAGRRCPGVGYPPVDQIEAVVLERLKARLAELQSDPAAVASARARRSVARAGASTLRGELTRTEAALGRLTSDHYLGKVGDAAYKVARADLEASVTSLLERLLDAERVPTRTVSVRMISDMLAVWPEATPAERNQLLRLAVSKVVVRKAVTWREPLEARTEVVLL